MDRLLDNIDAPEDLRELTLPQLEQLADEIRVELLEVVTQTGGHLASNLGVVETTLALHRVFDSPRDRLVWDVGHQAYVHKLLTGRRSRFSTLRRYGGLSGFPVREESPHDAFGTGHASTSISAALGMAVARDLVGDDYHVVAVIGDGAMTGGLAFEAINQAGHLATRLIVVLNDNAMSISPNVGALARMFNRLRLNPRYHRAKEEAEQVINGLPLGNQMLEAGRRMKNSFKGLIIPTMMWEELGFTYMGPVDGHNLADLQAAFAQAKAYPTKPTLIHVVTRKGKGYDPAEEDAVRYHGVPPSDVCRTLAPTYTQVFGRTLSRLFQTNPGLVAITAAMPDGTGLREVAREFPQRVIDVGICEEHAITFAAGMATQGLTPVVALYSTFLQRGYDQIVHDVCVQNLPVILAVDRAGLVGDDGKTHQGAFDLSFLRSIPNMVIAAPRDQNELQHLLYTAVQHAGVRRQGPIAIRYPRGGGVGRPLDAELTEMPLGKGELLRGGKDLALIAIGSMVGPALEAAEELAQQGLSAAVADARFVKPLDAELILSLAAKSGLLVTIEENVLAGGFGSAVLELLQSRGLAHVRVMRLGLPDEFIEHGRQDLLRARYDLDATGIAGCAMAAWQHAHGGRVAVSGVLR